MNALNKTFLDAAKTGDLIRAQSALANGADINTTDRYGNTALMTSASAGHLKICHLLLSKGAPPDLMNNNGKTATWMAISKKDDKITALLLSFNININAFLHPGNSYLHHAIYNECPEICLQLLQAGIDTELTTSKGNFTALALTKYRSANACAPILQSWLTRLSALQSISEINLSQSP